MKQTFGSNLLTGIKGLVVSIVTMLLMILPAWLIKWIWQTEGMLAVSALLGVVWIFFYFVVWGWLAGKFWKWK